MCLSPRMVIWSICFCVIWLSRFSCCWARISNADVRLIASRPTVTYKFFRLLMLSVLSSLSRVCVRGDCLMTARRFEPQGFLADQPVDRMLFSPGAYPNPSTRLLDRHAG